MACFHPLKAYRGLSGGPLQFGPRGSGPPVTIACGQCTGCRLERSRQWAVRVVHEASLWPDNSFLTLTYSSVHEDRSNSLVYRDFQLFMKRLRKRFSPRPLRFYMCGEYGSLNGRAHFHACVFNLLFTDGVFFKRSPSGANIYTSAVLSQLWPYGFSSFGDVTFDSAAYVARYCMKKVTGPGADAHYQRLDEGTGELVAIEPEFNSMSLKPGIGAKWFEKYRSDVTTGDFVLMNGVKMLPPKYYDTLYAEFNPMAAEAAKQARVDGAKIFFRDHTPARLEVRETVCRARLRFKSRDLE